MKRAISQVVATLVAAAMVGACGSEPAKVLAPAGMSAALALEDDVGPRYTAFSGAQNLGAVVNSPSEELAPFITRDGLSLYFGSPRPNFGNVALDLWVAHRASVDEPWGAPENLGPTVNYPGPVNDQAPMVSRNDHLLFFSSARPGGFGGQDIYVSRRQNRWSAWEAPVNVGDGVNGDGNEGAPFLFEDDETATTTLYFQSNRSTGLGGNDIYASVMQPDGSFGPAALVTEISSPADDQRVAISRDGLELFLASNRPGTLGGTDLWGATRARTSDPWSAPINLGADVNTVNADGGPAISFDGFMLLYHSANHPTNIGGPRFDIWMATRHKMKGQSP